MAKKNFNLDTNDIKNEGGNEMNEKFNLHNMGNHIEDHQGGGNTEVNNAGGNSNFDFGETKAFPFGVTGNTGEIPNPNPTVISDVADILSRNDYLDVLEFCIPIYELEEFIIANLGVKSKTRYMTLEARSFSNFINAQLINEYPNEDERLVEASKSWNLFTSGSNNFNEPVGYFLVGIKEGDLNNAGKGGDVLSYSTFNDPGTIYSTPGMMKLNFKDARKLFYTDVQSKTTYHLLPVISVALAKVGFEPDEVIKKYYVACKQSSSHAVLRIRRG